MKKIHKIIISLMAVVVLVLAITMIAIPYLQFSDVDNVTSDVPSNWEFYDRDGFGFYRPKDYKIRDVGYLVEVASPETETIDPNNPVSYLTMLANIPGQDSMVTNINERNCDLVRKEVAAQVLGIVDEVEGETQFTDLNGSDSCYLSYVQDEFTLYIYTVNFKNSDTFSIAVVQEDEFTTKDELDTFLSIAKSFTQVEQPSNTQELMDLNREKLNMYSEAPGVLEDLELRNKVSIIKTEKGEFTIDLFDEEARLAVSSHIFLSKNNFYNNIAFHRREDGFVLQGGDPLGDSDIIQERGTGGPGYSFEDEPITRDYTRGVVAMANSGPNTNGSQFFIMLDDALELPKQYTIFGEVISGMDVVDSLQAGDRILEITIVDQDLITQQ